ncbi:MAG TPA: hypothetical protein VLX61_11885 [Anaerolineales bacterium]|nr:hypothetical protein [Anaerolineales bacterium]
MPHLYRMSRRIIAFLVIAAALAGCAPSRAAIQTAIAQTQSADTPTPELATTTSSTPVPATLASIPTQTPAPSPIPKAGSVGSPIPFHQKGTLTDALSGATFDLQVQQVVRGPEAIYLIQQASTKNLNPPQGMEYVLVQVTITLDAGDLNISDYDFMVSSNGQLSDSFSSPVCCMINVGYQMLHADLSSLGASTDGWIARMTFIDDPRPLLAYRAGVGNDPSQAVFFSLSPATQSP